jgi:hypothetical protein
MKPANDFGYMLATHNKAPEGLYNLLALASGVPDGFRLPHPNITKTLTVRYALLTGS